MKFLKFCLSLLLFSIVSSQIVNGCSCGIIPPPCYQYWESDAVFVGTIKRVFKDTEFPFDRVEVDVQENLRGMSFKTALTYNGMSSCHWTFSEGEKFLFYADINPQSPNEFGTGYCTRTNSYSSDLIDFDFFNLMKSSTPNYWIWGTISQSENKPLAGIKADVFIDGQKITGTSDKDGNLKIVVSKEGKYKVRVFLPQNVFLIPSQQEIQGKIKKKEVLNSEVHYVEYEVEVKNNRCGWFEMPVTPPQNTN